MFVSRVSRVEWLMVNPLFIGNPMNPANINSLDPFKAIRTMIQSNPYGINFYLLGI